MPYFGRCISTVVQETWGHLTSGSAVRVLWRCDHVDIWNIWTVIIKIKRGTKTDLQAHTNAANKMWYKENLWRNLTPKESWKKFGVKRIREEMWHEEERPREEMWHKENLWRNLTERAYFKKCDAKKTFQEMWHEKNIFSNVTRRICEEIWHKEMLCRNITRWDPLKKCDTKMICEEMWHKKILWRNVTQRDIV